MNDFKTVKQIADMLNVDSRVVRHWIAAGKLPNAQKIDPELVTSPYLVPMSDIETFLENHPKYQKK